MLKLNYQNARKVMQYSHMSLFISHKNEHQVKSHCPCKRLQHSHFKSPHKRLEILFFLLGSMYAWPHSMSQNCLPRCYRGQTTDEASAPE
jgi:hypothetical protein